MPLAGLEDLYLEKSDEVRQHCEACVDVNKTTAVLVAVRSLCAAPKRISHLTRRWTRCDPRQTGCSADIVDRRVPRPGANSVSIHGGSPRYPHPNWSVDCQT